MSKTTVNIPTEQLTQYDQLVASNPEYERKGKTTPYTSLNGHMYSFLSKTGSMGLRLSKEDREQFMHDYQAELMEQHGRVMKEFVCVPESLLSDLGTISDWLQKSYDHTAGMKPKPAKKK